MSVERVERQGGAVWRVRWREGGRDRSKVIGRKRDAEAFEAEVRRGQRLGGFDFEASTETLDQYVCGTWAHAHAAHLAPRTRQVYAWAYDLHIAPRLGGVALRRVNPEMVARFQADLLAAGVGAEAVRKSVTLLGGILQRAAEARRIPYNPARVVRKAPLPPRDEVRPLAPATVEAMRAAVSPRDATLLSVLAYAGLRPQEARGLRWTHVGERTLVINAPKTRQRRSVRLLAPLAPTWPRGALFAGARRTMCPSSPALTAGRGAPTALASGAGGASLELCWRQESSTRAHTTCATRSPRCCYTRGAR